MSLVDNWGQRDSGSEPIRSPTLTDHEPTIDNTLKRTQEGQDHDHDHEPDPKESKDLGVRSFEERITTR